MAINVAKFIMKGKEDSFTKRERDKETQTQGEIESAKQRGWRGQRGYVGSWMAWARLWRGWRGSIKFWRGSKKLRGCLGGNFGVGGVGP